MKPGRAERLSGGLIGLLVGDALGVPYEFRAPHELPSPELIEFEPPPRFRRSHPGAAVGARVAALPTLRGLYRDQPVHFTALND